MLDPPAEALREMGEIDLDALSVGELNELVVGMQRLRGALDAAEARVLARWDSERCWRLDGAKTGAAWLSTRCRLPRSVAQQRIRRARAMRQLPEVAAAWADGELDRSHVIALLGARSPRTETAFARPTRLVTM